MLAPYLKGAQQGRQRPALNPPTVRTPPPTDPPLGGPPKPTSRSNNCHEPLKAREPRCLCSRTNRRPAQKRNFEDQGRRVQLSASAPARAWGSKPTSKGRPVALPRPPPNPGPSRKPRTRYGSPTAPDEAPCGTRASPRPRRCSGRSARRLWPRNRRWWRRCEGSIRSKRVPAGHWSNTRMVETRQVETIGAQPRVASFRSPSACRLAKPRGDLGLQLHARFTACHKGVSRS